jgi:hypothetical protein
MHILAKPTIGSPCAQMPQTIGFGIPWANILQSAKCQSNH